MGRTVCMWWLASLMAFSSFLVRSHEVLSGEGLGAMLRFLGIGEGLDVRMPLRLGGFRAGGNCCGLAVWVGSWRDACVVCGVVGVPVGMGGRRVVVAGGVVFGFCGS